MGGLLEGKAAVVTGAGRGIGRCVALSLAREGARVVVNDLGGAVDGLGQDSSPAEVVAGEIRAAGGIALANYESVADFDAASRIVSACVEQFGQIDILVNVAGISRARMIFNMTEEDWSRVLSVHLNGTFNLTRHACVFMRQQRSGRIINTTSSARLGATGTANYSAAKGGIASLTASTAMDMGRYGVTVNAIDPSARTRLTDSEEHREGVLQRFAAGMISREQMDAVLNQSGPEHVGPLVAYLASDEAANINGQVFHVEGARIGIFAEPVEVHTVHRDFVKQGPWTVEELRTLVPQSLLVDYVNPAPPKRQT